MAHTFNAPPLQIPDGRYAGRQDMEEFGHTLQNFIQEQKASLAQIGRDARHNQIASYMEVLSDSYNEQLAIFRHKEIERRQQLLAKMTQLTMQHPRIR